MSKSSLAQETRANKTVEKEEKEKSTFLGNLEDNFFLPTECMMSNFFANAKSPQKVFLSDIVEVLYFQYCSQYNETSLDKKYSLRKKKKQVVKWEWNIANDELVLINQPLLPQELPAKFTTAAPLVPSCRPWPSRAGCSGGAHNADMAHGRLQSGFALHQREFYLRFSFPNYVNECLFLIIEVTSSDHMDWLCVYHRPNNFMGCTLNFATFTWTTGYWFMVGWKLLKMELMWVMGIVVKKEAERWLWPS